MSNEIIYRCYSCGRRRLVEDISVLSCIDISKRFGKIEIEIKHCRTKKCFNKARKCLQEELKDIRGF